MEDFSGLIHIIIAVAAAYFLKAPASHFLGVSLEPFYVVGLMIGSFLPDIDHPSATINQKILQKLRQKAHTELARL